MYRLDWIEHLKLRTEAMPSADQATAVSPMVWRLGFTSFLTDISAEMVNSVLPVYLVLHLHASPLAFGAIDGMYHGMTVALLSLAGGVLADRWRRYREVAAAGYGLSAVCKLGMIAAGASPGWIGAVTALDRVGKGARVAPRDAILSLNSSPALMATSFAVHRALDAGGSLLGPVIAFFLISQLPGAYHALWTTSFVFALLGLAVLLLFVENPPAFHKASTQPALAAAFGLIRTSRDFRAIVFVGGLLALVTVSDGFVYLLLQRQSATQAEFFPLYYVVTATTYMVLSIPVGRLADRIGRGPVLLTGYTSLLIVYAMLWSGTLTGRLALVPLLLFGLYYAASEGVLMAIASSSIPASLRTSGLAVLTTVIGLGKMLSSLAFGWLWHTHGMNPATIAFAIALVAAIVVSKQVLHEPQIKT